MRKDGLDGYTGGTQRQREEQSGAPASLADRTQAQGDGHEQRHGHYRTSGRV